MVKVDEVEHNWDISEEELLDNCIERYYSDVKKIAVSYIGDITAAEDITQEVFIKVYKNLSKFKKDSHLFTWIYRITINQCKDYVKSAYYRRFTGTDICEFTKQLTEADFSEEVLDRATVIQEVSMLPEKLKDVVILYYYNQLTSKEISRVLRIRESTVRTRLTRARSMLARVLQEEGR